MCVLVCVWVVVSVCMCARQMKWTEKDITHNKYVHPGAFLSAAVIVS
jgi:hypothetical protein